MKDADQMLKEVVATMELSGFKINDKQKNMLLQGIREEKSFGELKGESLKKILTSIELDTRLKH